MTRSELIRTILERCNARRDAGHDPCGCGPARSPAAGGGFARRRGRPGCRRLRPAGAARRRGRSRQ